MILQFAFRLLSLNNVFGGIEFVFSKKVSRLVNTISFYEIHVLCLPELLKIETSDEVVYYQLLDLASV
jgi:hypothetical protein